MKEEELYDPDFKTPRTFYGYCRRMATHKKKCHLFAFQPSNTRGEGRELRRVIFKQHENTSKIHQSLKAFSC